jgi:hypothetical protein
VTWSRGIRLGYDLCFLTDANSCRLSSWPRVTSPWPPGSTSSVRLFYPNQLVCSYHFDHGVSLDLAMTTASLWAIGIALCHLVARLWCHMSWFGSWIVPSFIQPSSVPWRVGRRSGGSILSSSSLVLNPRRSRKMWVESLGLFGVCCSFHSTPPIPVIAMASGSKEGESCISSYLLVLTCLSPCMLVPCRP